MVSRLRQLPRPLFFLFAGTTISRLGAFVFPFLTIYLSEARGYGADRVGQILSFGGLGLLFGNFTGGWLTDRWSRRYTLLLALVLNAAGFAGLAFDYQGAWSYAAFLLLGYFGMGMYTPASNTVVADLAPEAIRPFAYTVNYVCVNLGMALGPLIAGFLAASSYKWLFIGDVITTLLCAVMILIGVAETRHAAPASGAGGTPRLPAAKVRTPGGSDSYLRIWTRYPVVLAFCLAYFFLIGPLMGLEYAVPLLVKKTFAAELKYVGIVYTINAVCILALSFRIERLVTGRAETPAMVVAGLFWIAGLAVLLVGFSIPALLVCTAIWTVGEIIASILVPSFIAKHVHHAVKGRYLALIDIVRSFAGIICPIGLGLIWEARDAKTVVYVIAALPVVGTIAYLVMWMSHGMRRRAETQPAASEA